MEEMIARLLSLALLLSASGCSSLGSSVVRTGSSTMPPYPGPVAVFASQSPPTGSELGKVEVHAADLEAVIETLFPLFVARVAGLGGNAAVIDGMDARFEMVIRPYAETYYFPCGFHAACVGTRMVLANDEVMLVTLRGRALSVGPPGTAR